MSETTQTQTITDGNETRTTTIRQTLLVEQMLADNIAYGPSVKIDSDNVEDLGLPEDTDIKTFGMDENGKLTEGFNFKEESPEDFLNKAGFDDGSNHEQANANFMIQQVFVEGQEAGYFIFNENPEFGNIGLYLDTETLNEDTMSPTIKEALSPITFENFDFQGGNLGSPEAPETPAIEPTAPQNNGLNM
ncbi:MAG: hypothetical protein ACRBDL_09995 [Alphaproteobacteria bacterium]